MWHDPTHPPIHLPLGGGVSTNDKPSNRIELSWLGQDLFDFQWFDRTTPIHPPIQLANHTVSTDFKSWKRIELSWLVQDLLNFTDLEVLPWGMGGWIDWVVDVWGYLYIHMCLHACACAHIWHHRGSPNGNSHLKLKLSCLTCMQIHMCTHVCVWACVGHLPHTPTTPSTHPQGETSQISKNPIYLEIIGIIQLCLKICDIWTLLHSYILHLVCMQWGV